VDGMVRYDLGSDSMTTRGPTARCPTTGE
jgi:hypothetical protein